MLLGISAVKPPEDKSPPVVTHLYGSSRAASVLCLGRIAEAMREAEKAGAYGLMDDLDELRRQALTLFGSIKEVGDKWGLDR